LVVATRYCINWLLVLAVVVVVLVGVADEVVRVGPTNHSDQRFQVHSALQELEQFVKRFLNGFKGF